MDADLAYPGLMNVAAFVHVEVTDVTTEYTEALTPWWREWEVESFDLKRIVGDDEYTERQASRIRASRAVQNRLLRRYPISGVRA